MKKEIKKTSLLEKFKSLNRPLKCGVLIAIFWIPIFIESMIFGFSDWYSLPIHTLILAGLGTLVFAFLFVTEFAIPVGGWFLNLFKKK